MPNHEIKVLRAGDTSKRNPYTIAIVNNPAIEIDEEFFLDPIVNKKSKFEKSVDYIHKCLFGNLPHQAEKFLNHPSINGKIKVVSVWVGKLPVADKNSLVFIEGEFRARRQMFVEFFSQFDLNPDVAFAVTDYKKEGRNASAFWAIDDKSKGGEYFTLDGKRLLHGYYHEEPGAVAIHTSDDSLTAIHEFGHAASSETGYIGDLYNESSQEFLTVNKKFADKIPNIFCEYNGETYHSNPKRSPDPRAQTAYHAALFDTDFPALMDNYTLVKNGFPEQCQHDKLTRQFLLDRIRVKTQR